MGICDEKFAPFWRNGRQVHKVPSLRLCHLAALSPYINSRAAFATEAFTLGGRTIRGGDTKVRVL